MCISFSNSFSNSSHLFNIFFCANGFLSFIVKTSKYIPCTNSAHSALNSLFTALFLHLFTLFDVFSIGISNSKSLIKSSHSRISCLTSLLYFDLFLHFVLFSFLLACARSDSILVINSSHSRMSSLTSLL